MGYNTKIDKYCKMAVNRYTTLSSATTACNSDPECGGVYDYCGRFPREFYACPPPFKESDSTCGSILYAKRKYFEASQNLIHYNRLIFHFEFL